MNHEKEFKAVLATLKNNKVMVKTEEDGIYVRLAGKESKGEAFSLEWGKVLSFEGVEPKNVTTEYIKDFTFDDENPDYIRQSQEEI